MGRRAVEDDALRESGRPYTLTNLALVAALGAETDFTVRAYLALGGHRSLDSDSVTVSKT